MRTLIARLFGFDKQIAALRAELGATAETASVAGGMNLAEVRAITDLARIGGVPTAQPIATPMSAYLKQPVPTEAASRLLEAWCERHRVSFTVEFGPGSERRVRLPCETVALLCPGSAAQETPDAPRSSTGAEE